MNLKCIIIGENKETKEVILECEIPESLIARNSKVRNKREPSKYNIFMRNCLQKLKSSDILHKEKFKQCALEYKQVKGSV